MKGKGKLFDGGNLRKVWSESLLRMVRARRGVVLLAGLGISVGVIAFDVGYSQVPQYNNGMPGVERSASGFPGLPENANPRPDANRALRDAMNQQVNLKQLKELNLRRQKDMNTDAGKMITLANEVKAQTNKPVDAAGKDTLSVLDLHKVEMIEKLAKSVREKMTATITAPASAPN